MDMEKIERINISRPVIERIPPPIVDRPEVPILNIPRPVVDIPRPRIDYPVIDVPSQTPAPAPSSEGKKEEEKKTPKRELPITPPPPAPELRTPALPQIPVALPEVPKEEIGTVTIIGHEIQVPTPKEVVQASVTAVVGTSATLATAIVFNQARRLIGDTVTKAARSKFKIKLRYVKPVLHFVRENDEVTVLEYSSEGVKTVAKGITNPEQFLRDTVETDELFEADHKIVIDEPIREMFTKEGAKRFSYFAPPKKMAKRLAARFIFG